jgi:hypothetical protein
MARRLRTLQQWMQSVITHPLGVEAGLRSDQTRASIDVGPDEIENVIRPSRALSSVDRLGVYANAYYARLLECLGDVFPVLKQSLGDETFGEFALGYLQQYPSQSYTLEHLGERLADYLDQTRPDRKAGDEPPVDWPDFLIDLARLEWAIGQVFDGPGVEGQTLALPGELHRIAPEHWPSARLVPVECLRLLAFRFPVNGYFTAARAAPPDEPPEMPEPAESYVALTRRDYVVRRYPLSRPQYELLAAIIGGQRVDSAIEAAGPWLAGEDVQVAEQLRRWFAYWAAEGFFASVVDDSTRDDDRLSGATDGGTDA